MMEQTRLPLDEFRTLEERFGAFHRSNPEVYRRLTDAALRLRGLGHERVSITLLWERLRWLDMISTVRKDTYRLNNNLKPLYARMLMERNPDLEGFFETRKRTVD